ncbi:MAG: response regulator [Chloroflexales bacterium]
MNPTIMVIDDEPLISQLLCYQLSDAGYTVATYQSGRKAMLHIPQIQPDLVLLDVMMPEMSGYDLCREIRAFSQVPVIMLTAKQSDDDMVAGLTLGADDYIGKPFNAPQLIARVEAVLRRSGRTPALRPARLQIDPPVGSQPPRHVPVARPSTTITSPRLGPRLSAARRERGLSLHDASQACGIRWEFLQAIELEQFSYIPRADLRVALRSYSTWLNVDLRAYMRPRDVRHSLHTNLILAVALCLLLILILTIFTL